jgi:hypothetical protein
MYFERKTKASSLDLNLSQWFIVFFILNKGKKILEESV